MFSVMDRPLNVAGQEVHLPLSLGVSIYPENGNTAEELIKNADAALYEAKRMGNNNCKFYKSEMSSLGEQWVRTENRLRRAVEREEFILHYQPQVNLSTGKIIGFEALIRWQDPEDGLRGPGEFISVAEETGLIIPIGDWVLREACRQARAWQDRGLKAARVSVNISMRQFRLHEFCGSVAHVLEETGLEPGRLKIELTESMVMSNVSDTIRKLKDLKELGVRLAMDDFGTGYSSLTYLKLMPLDVIKIDQSFVKDLTTDANNAAIVKAIVMMSESLRIKTVAEGVETKDQLIYLKQLGCGAIQGYFLSRPDCAEAMERFLDGAWGLEL
jgi:EAL domain-containing protein (putative c-di-GMP-specific phosphodiesterase class I)